MVSGQKKNTFSQHFSSLANHGWVNLVSMFNSQPILPNFVFTHVSFFTMDLFLLSRPPRIPPPKKKLKKLCINNMGAFHLFFVDKNIDHPQILKANFGFALAPGPRAPFLVPHRPFLTYIQGLKHRSSSLSSSPWILREIEVGIPDSWSNLRSRLRGRVRGGRGGSENPR